MEIIIVILIFEVCFSRLLCCMPKVLAKQAKCDCANKPICNFWVFPNARFLGQQVIERRNFVTIREAFTNVLAKYKIQI